MGGADFALRKKRRGARRNGVEGADERENAHRTTDISLEQNEKGLLSISQDIQTLD